MVRLQAEHLELSLQVELLSIPIWYDYKHCGNHKRDSGWDFQFQYGTITSRGNVAQSNGIGSFQFQYGTITSQQEAGFFSSPRLLSIPIWYDYKAIRTRHLAGLSRLSIPIWYDYKSPHPQFQKGYSSLSIPIWYDYKYMQQAGVKVGDNFQFQYGTITSPRSHRADAQPGRFQFQYGTITRTWPRCSPSTSRRLSIPIWYDYKATLSHQPIGWLQLSIPIWYDYKEGSYLIKKPRIELSIPIWYDYKLRCMAATVYTPPPFNSNMVRLQVSDPGFSKHLFIPFNSNMVRLQVLVIDHREVDG